MKVAGIKLTIGAVCTRSGMARQNYYLARRKRASESVAKERVIELVKDQRKLHPCIGTRKIHHLIGPQLDQEEIRLGRDRFFELLRQELLVERRRRSVKTTNSRHTLPIFRNKLRDLEVSAPNQAWVADLTYIRTANGFMYASLITDVYSRMIVGYHMDDTLESEGCLKALKMAT